MSINLSFLYPFYSVDARAVWRGQLVVLLVIAAVVAVVSIPLGPETRALRWLSRCGAAGMMLIAGSQVALLIAYIFYPSYLNHAEAMTAAISWLGWEGHPLYPNLETGDVYGNPYGPLFYQVTGLFLWLFGPSITAGKIYGLGAFALSAVLCLVTLRRSGAGVSQALTMAAVQCVLLAGFTPEGVVSGVRSDTFLLLGSQAAVLIGTARPTWLATGALGLLSGICFDLRIDGVLYILPAFVYCLYRSPSTSAVLRLTCVAGLAGGLAVVLPFTPGNVSWSEYGRYLQVMSHHPWERWLFEQNIVFEAMLLAPLLSLYALFIPKLARAFKWSMLTLILCMTLVTYPAGASGAGPHHLLPFLPAVVWGFVVISGEVRASFENVRARGRYEGLSLGLLAAFLFGYGPIVLASWSAVLHRFADAPLVSKGMAELNKVLDDHPSLRVAVGPSAGSAGFDAEALRVIPVFRGNPLPLDSAAWMNFEAEGASDEMIRRAITECRVDLWLLPAGAPFVRISHYNGRNIFSPQVLADFHAAYAKDRSGEIFDQWRCRRHGNASEKQE